MPVSLQCPEDENVALSLVQQHLLYNHQQPQAPAPPAQPRAEKIEKPKLALKDGQLEETAWDFFLHEWTVYKVQTNVTERQKHHLAACLDREIRQQIFNRLGTDGWDALTENQLLDSVKEMFLRKKNRFVNRIKLTRVMQGPNEPVQQYLATLKQTSRTCLFNFKCTAPNNVCDHMNNYENEMVLNGERPLRPRYPSKSSGFSRRHLTLDSY